MIGKNEDLCEICGDAATVYVCDMKYFDNYYSGYKEYKPNGEHTFCDKHKREGRDEYGGPIYGAGGHDGK